MAFCKACGNQIADTDKFCQSCGAPVMRAAAQGGQNTAGYGQQGQQYQQYGQQNQQYRQYGQPYGYGSGGPARRPGGLTPVQQVLKDFGGSILFLIYIAVSALAMVLTLISGGAGWILMLVGMVPSILVLIGMIMAFVECKSVQGAPKGNGIGVYRAGKIVLIVYVAVLAAVLLITLLIGGSLLGGALGSIGGLDGLFGMLDEYGYSSYGSYGSQIGYATLGVVNTVMVVFIIIAFVIIFLVIMQAVKLLQTAKIIRQSLITGRPAGQISIFPAVMNIISAVLTAIFVFMMIGTIASVSYYGVSFGGTSALVLFTGIFTLAQLVLGAVLIIRLRGQMSQIQ